jgi:predicted  nucleic acid-binding Zn-ribbon protein
MKWIKKILMTLFGKLARANKDEITKAQNWIDKAQATFANAIEEALIAEEQFDKVVKDAKSKINELQSRLEDAETRKQQAVKFKEKVQSFLED